ncbi:MAG TPA: hypothetical protein VL137_02540 [Polyangiaceae bacterium]|nr:hypothetical protein [Polyangiaceae bacterium]
MTGRRYQGLWAISSCLCLLHCHSDALPAAPGATSTIRPAAIVLDPASDLPRARAIASSGQQRITLIEPAARAAIFACVQRLFAAIVQEDLTALQGLLTADATQIGNTHRQNSRAFEYWKQRLEKLDYTDLSPRLIYTPQSITVLSEQQAAQREANNDDHLALRPGEILVSIPISSNVKAPRRFGTVIELALTPVGREYKIRALQEDFEAP